jgi:hypothetical protein
VQPLAMLVLVVYLGVFLSAGLVEWLLWSRIAGEVNLHLPPGEQYSVSIWALRRSAHGEFNQFRIWQLHRRLFRKSYLRLVFLSALALTAFWTFFGLTILNGLLPS